MYTIGIPRKHLSTKGTDGVKMYFDLEIGINGHTIRANGFRLVEKEGKSFVGFPSVMGKDGKRYPSFIPPKDMSEAIQVRAEQIYHTLGRTHK
jgi:hypothetical protein